MDDLPIYFDAAAGVYRFINDVDDDSGVEEVPFSSYNTTEESEVASQNLEESQKFNFQSDQRCDLDEDDLTYVDDDRDDDYRPNKSAYIPKKSKTKHHKRRQYNTASNHDNQYKTADSYDSQYSTFNSYDSQYNTGYNCDSQYSTGDGYDMSMFMPERPAMDHSDPDSSGSSTRQYARKDRTPRTILKMMEKHRESERVRHHTLNESMKDVCMRIPGYDPDIKETKVIQMQRIIGYECFLENTLTALCGQLGTQPKMLRLGTHFITDAMKDTPIEDFYKASHYKTSDIDEDEDDYGGLHKTRDCKLPLRCRVVSASSADQNVIKYRREKISSPTVDSTTDNIIQIFPASHRVSNMAACQTVDSSHDSSWPTQSFIPIESSQGLFSSQESGIKVETQSSIDEDAHFTDLATLIERGLLHEPDHLNTVSFMKDEMVPTSTNPDDCDGFSLSSPVRYNSNIFIHSPPASGIWHHSSRLHYLGKSDTPSGKEMQTVSPENVLETKPKGESVVPEASPRASDSFSSSIRPLTAILSPSLRKTHTTQPITLSNVNFTRIGNQAWNAVNNKTQNRTCATYMLNGADSDQFTKSCEIQTGSTGTKRTLEHMFLKNENMQPGFRYCETEKNEAGIMMGSPEGKNKRKRYTPLRSPFVDVTNHSEEIDDETRSAVSNIINICHKEDGKTHSADCSQPTVTNRNGLESRTAMTLASEANRQSTVEYMANKIDHRRSTWMNGFMMFSQINRSKFTSANPGVHTSHIQKMLGHVWRNMTPEDQKPYKDKAKLRSNYISSGHDKMRFAELADHVGTVNGDACSVVHSSTTGDD